MFYTDASLTSNFIFNQITMAWIIAEKLEMTRVIKGEKFVPITLLKVPELRVVWFKTMQKDGYDALVLGVVKKWAEVSLEEGKTTLNKSQFETIVEFSMTTWKKLDLATGDVVTLDVLDGVEKVRIEWFSKWKWFAGAMKRWNFAGWPATHGSKFHRALGSIWNRKPRRTHKGKKMHGHMGDDKITLKDVSIELVNKEISVIWVRGWVPGGRKSLVNIIF